MRGFPKFLAPAEGNISFARDFTKWNLPFGSFRLKGGSKEDVRLATVIGDKVIDLKCLAQKGQVHPSLGNRYLNDFMSTGKSTWSETREKLQKLISDDDAMSLKNNPSLMTEAVHPFQNVEFELPVQVGDYTDFYASKEHATNLGTILRGPENPLLPNWVHIPVGYHGRSSSLVVSGTPITRPQGQSMPPGGTSPKFGPCAALDFELEMGFFVGTGNEMGEPIKIQDAADNIFGMVLLNDWSARDIQKWEGQPLGPFQAKNFATTLSPFIVTMEALKPFRTSLPPQDPQPLPYLQHAAGETPTFDINLEVWLDSDQLTAEHRLCQSNLKYMYWSTAQMLAHHSASGCPMKSGDLCGTGTISGPTLDMAGSLIEHTRAGKEPITLPNGETRAFIKDGDSIILRGFAEKDDMRVGFGECRGLVLPSKSI